MPVLPAPSQVHIVHPPGVANMAWPGARADGYDIEPDRGVGKPRSRGKEALCRSRNAHLLAAKDGFRCQDEIWPRLHFDEADCARWRPGYQINFTQMRANTAAEDAIELQGQEDSGKHLAAS